MGLDSSLRFIDTHCHLNLDDFEADRDQVIERAIDAGVQRILVPGIDIITSWHAIQLSQKLPGLYAAVGVHPNSGMSWDTDSIQHIKRLAHHSEVIALGEIGLDYYRKFTSKEVQRHIFIQQLELAKELCLPVVVHNRESSADSLEILKDWYKSLQAGESPLLSHPGVLHSFSGNLEEAQTAVEMNFLLGISGPVTYRNSQLLKSIVTVIPLDCLVIETDAPFLPPHPFRGQRNEPANVRIVAEKIAEIKQVPVDQVAGVTTESADQLFDWRVIH